MYEQRPARILFRRMQVEHLESRRLLAQGDLDPTFGNGGIVDTSDVSGVNQAHLALQANGKIVLVGGSLNQFIVSRHNATGAPDPSFGANGMTTTTFGEPGTETIALGVAIQTDGRIVVAGKSNQQFALARYNQDGTLDATFGNGGKVTTAFNQSVDHVALALQSDGKVIVAGSTVLSQGNEEILVARYNFNGSLDTSFHADGTLTMTIGVHFVAIDSVAVQSNGDIVVAGQYQSDSAPVAGIVLARFTPAGQSDNTFGTAGVALTNAGGASDIAITASGKIIAAGFVGIAGQYHLGVTQFHPDGSLDSSFGVDGQAPSAIGGFARGIALGSGGKIVVGGYYLPPGDIIEFAAARFNGDGSRDATFGQDGAVTTQVSPSESWGGDVAIQSDNKIVVAGWSPGTSVVPPHLALVRYLGDAPPVLTLGGSTTYVELHSPVVLAPGATVADPDNPIFNAGNLAVSIVANGAAGDRLQIQNQGGGPGMIGVSGNNVRYAGVAIGTFTGGSGSVPLSIALNDHASTAAVQALTRAITFSNVDANPSTALRSVQFVLNDGAGADSQPQFKAVNIQRDNGRPVIEMGGTAVYHEGAVPTVVSPNARVTDADSSSFGGGKLTVAIGSNAAATDRLSIRNQGTGMDQISVSGANVSYNHVVIGVISGGSGAAPLLVTLKPACGRAAIQALVQNVTFAALGENPGSAQRVLQFTLSDGSGNVSDNVLKPVSVIAVNDPVSLSIPSGAVGYVNNASAGVLIAPAATVSDVDSPNFLQGTLTVAVQSGASQANRIEIGGSFTVSDGKVLLGAKLIGTIGGNGVGYASLTITLTNQATPAIAQQLVRSLRFRTVEAAHVFPRTLALFLSDGPQSAGASATVSVNVQ
jgi:uncharacterized delta-60 repeat protein